MTLPLNFGLDGSVIAPISGTVEGQAEMLEIVLKENPDVLIISPTYPTPIIPILDRFVEQNIPVLLLDTDDPWENKTAYMVPKINGEAGINALQLPHQVPFILYRFISNIPILWQLC
ncbi:MAG: substrate-binding domain-containing protein [Bacillota bacterium]